MTMIVLYTGRRGSGKTLTMIKDAWQLYNSGYEIYSNINIGFDHTFIDGMDAIQIDKNSDLKDCVLLIDELQVLFDSRKSMKKENVNFSNFLQQIRKRNIILLCTTQFAGTVDLRLRQHVDIIARPRYLEKYRVCEVLYLDATAYEDTSATMESMTRLVVYDPEPIFKMYNTLEMV